MALPEVLIHKYNIITMVRLPELLCLSGMTQISRLLMIQSFTLAQILILMLNMMKLAIII